MKVDIHALHSRRELVTGASTGSGAAAEKAFCSLVSKFSVHYNHSEDAANEVVDAICTAGGDAIKIRADVRDSEAIRACVRHVDAAFAGIDILVNNAGSLVRRAPIAEFTDELIDDVLHITARSMLAFCREAVPVMRRGGGGIIINVTSIAARHGGGPGAFLY